MKLLQIRYEHISNVDSWEKAVFESIGKKYPKRYNNFKGFIERKVYTSDSKIITHTKLINGLPAQRFRESAKKAGLIGKKFDLRSSPKKEKEKANG